jgi:DNA uptake protein ComE-like DNA-binding protein
VEHRRQRGPFTSIEGLLDVRGIGPAKLADLRNRVTV